MIRDHVRWAHNLHDRLAATPGVEILTAPDLSLFTFRREGALDADTIAHVSAINDDGRIYLTQTRVDGRLVIRFQAGSHAMREADIDIAYAAILDGLGLQAEER
jgi:aromatic-L-amino-acid decarboxylase